MAAQHLPQNLARPSSGWKNSLKENSNCDCLYLSQLLQTFTSNNQRKRSYFVCFHKTKKIYIVFVKTMPLQNVSRRILETMSLCMVKASWVCNNCFNFTNTQRKIQKQLWWFFYCGIKCKADMNTTDFLRKSFKTLNQNLQLKLLLQTTQQN